MDPVDNSSATVHYDFENPIYQAEDGSEEDCEVPGELARLLREEKTIQPHEESIEIVNLGTEINKKEVRAKGTDCETRYSQLEKACCALAWAARRLRQYLLNHTTLLASKMDSVKYLFEKPAVS
ncbi:hypothetical protein KIW84_057821 [Lathyrus oleraceus]|uniref:Reverse transcriptase RNase H-like domain-containing protein n=1 Tax=Pisum sativum TaxID=3888 RepID=A0A9D4X6Z3_PEA|nr:hypothetical protein KIW84_057821 [Pisum sativum]